MRPQEHHAPSCSFRARSEASGEWRQVALTLSVWSCDRPRGPDAGSWSCPCRSPRGSARTPDTVMGPPAVCSRSAHHRHAGQPSGQASSSPGRLAPRTPRPVPHPGGLTRARLRSHRRCSVRVAGRPQELRPGVGAPGGSGCGADATEPSRDPWWRRPLPTPAPLPGPVTQPRCGGRSHGEHAGAPPEHVQVAGPRVRREVRRPRSGTAWLTVEDRHAARKPW